ncbi:MAG TPA: arabinofuranosyltransferase, partial [candidate division Zixibacteria bacterium]|nr:arabinofuranosyltransferase [candidate division Zixibacteria bacterium]
MTLITDIKNRILPVILGSAFVIFGISLFVNSHSTKPFSEELLIYDLIWMDAWSLAFLGILITFWVSKLGRNEKVIYCIGLLSIYLVVATSLILNGTPFYLFGFWGDQSFRQAMILKFADLSMPSDYYYKDLPPFYPPLYYYLQAIFARVFSVEAYKMSKLGQILIFAILPLVHFYFWRRIVAPIQAGFITLLAFLYSNYAGALQFFSPHSFITYALFIPWWLYYIERVTKPISSWKFYVIGGVIGALLFATYFYAFFIGGVSLLLRLVYDRIPLIKKKIGGFTHIGAFKVLIVSAVFSSPYWLPVLISIISNGIDRSRGGWYHIGYPGLDIQFVKVSIEGVALLVGTVFIFRRLKRPVNFALAN